MKTIILVFFGLFIAIQGQARPASDEEVGIRDLYSHYKFDFLADGTLNSSTKMGREILRESAVNDYSTYSVTYDVVSSSIQKLKAWIETPDGKRVNVDPKNIADKSLANNASGYNEMRQRYFPWPGLVKGSKLFLELQEQEKPETKNIVASRLHVGAWYATGDYTFELAVPQGTNVVLVDKFNRIKPYLKHTQTPEGHVYKIQMKNTKNRLYLSEDNAIDAEDQMAYFDISNQKTWEEAAKVKSSGYEDVLKQPVPNELQKLLGAKPQVPLNNEQALEQLTLMMNKIISSVRYFGDWRRTGSGFVPRDLAEIARTLYGDCKDYAVLTVLAARHLGLKANVAVVNRGLYPPLIDPQLPMAYGFTNHAIARVVAPDGEVWWTDATNPRSPVGLVPVDLADRVALVMAVPGYLERIPALNSSEHSLTINSKEKILNAKDIKINFQAQSVGIFGWQDYVDIFDRDEASLKSNLIDWAGVKESEASDFKLWQLDFEKMFPFKVNKNFEVTQKNGIMRSGNYKIKSLDLVSATIEALLNVHAEDRVTDLGLRQPRVVNKTVELDSSSFTKIVAEPKSCDLHSPWVDFTRQAKRLDNGNWQLYSSTLVKKYRVSVSEMKSPSFLEFQSQLADCVQRMAVVVE